MEEFDNLLPDGNMRCFPLTDMCIMKVSYTECTCSNHLIRLILMYLLYDSHFLIISISIGLLLMLMRVEVDIALMIRTL